MGGPGPGLPPVGRRGPGHRHHRPHREGARRTRAEGAAASAVRLGVQPRHPRYRPVGEDRRRPRLGGTRLAAGRRTKGHRDGAPGAGGMRPHSDREGSKPGRRSGASGRCFTTRSATPSSRATSPPTRSTASSGPPPLSRRASTAASWSAPPRPGTSWRPSGSSATGERTWKPSAPACTTPRCARRRRSCSARVTCTCPPRGGAGSSWPPPRPGRARPGPTTAPPARNAA
jgi:hypothetical protein